MNTIEILRTVVGIFFIIYGLGIYAYDITHEMEYPEFRYSPFNWLICLVAGIIIASYSSEKCLLYCLISIIIWIIEKKILKKQLRKLQYKK